MSKYAISIPGSGVLLALVLAIALPVQATPPNGSATATFQVSLTVLNDCSISANPLAFGNATSALATTPITQKNTTLSVTCSTGLPYTLSLDKGSVTNSSIGTRLLGGTGSNTQTVQYQLYTDVGLGTVFGDGSGTSSTVTGTGTGSAVSVTIYGEVPAQPVPAADSYTSTETATVAF